MKAKTGGEPDLPGTDDPRALIDELDAIYARLHRSSLELVETFYPAAFQGGSSRAELDSMRDNVLRTVAVIEQTFGGITANLWDDPFEWTLPETLNTRQRMIEYLEEVEATRHRAFGGMANDSELSQEIVVPSGERCTLIDLLRQTISRATGYQDRAFEIRELLAARESQESASADPCSR